MTKHLLLTVVCVLVLGCHIMGVTAKYTTHPEFKGYVVKFLDTAKKLDVRVNPASLRVLFNNETTTSEYGTCFIYLKTVHINQVHWRKLNSCYKEQLIFHFLS